MTSPTTDLTGNNTATATTTVANQADLSITKDDGVTSVTAGDGVIRDLHDHRQQRRPGGRAGVSFTDTWPTGFTRGTLPAGCANVGAGPNFTCSLGALANGAVVTKTITYTVPASTTASPQVNSVDGQRDSPTDPNTANNTATDSNTVATSADLSITKADSDDAVNPGQAFNYTVVVTNNGVSVAANVHVDDLVPAAFTVSGTPTATAGSCSATLNDVDCDLTSLSPLGTWTITIPVTVAATTEGTHNNTASVTSSTTDPTPGNNSDTESTTIDVLPDITVTKTATRPWCRRPAAQSRSPSRSRTTPPRRSRLTSLVDSAFGNLNGQGTCATGGTIAGGATYTCSFSQIGQRRLRWASPREHGHRERHR